MKISDILTELRKNPDQNPKVTVNTELATALDQISEYGNPTNLFISFTAVDKLGINPQSKYLTPIGIYAYPAEYVADSISSERPMTDLPFAGDSPYATIFKSQGNIIQLDKMDNYQVSDYYRKIAKYWSQVSGRDWKTSVDEVEDIINQAGNKATFGNRPGGRFWHVTREVAIMLANVNKPPQKPAASIVYPHRVSWNTLFRAIGIAGCVDSGVGIIHTAEPHQAVFFDIGAVDVIKRVLNRKNYAPDIIDKNIKRGQSVKTDMASAFKRFRNMSIDEQERAVMFEPASIRFVPNPSEELQWAACKKDPAAIAGIRNPSEQLQLYVISRSGTYIAYLLKTVRKPSEAVQIAAINQRSSTNAMLVFNHIMYRGILPTPAVQMAAVGQDFRKTLELLAKYKINPSEEVKLKVAQEIERRKYW
jgi:hypothetical protein